MTNCNQLNEPIKIQAFEDREMLSDFVILLQGFWTPIMCWV
jgi:hypothetical protein